MIHRPATPPQRRRTPLRHSPQRPPFSLLEQLEARRLLAGDGLRAEYFDNIDFTAPRVDRVDHQVNFDWGYGSPAAGMGADHFSVRWSGQVEAPATGTFNFHTYSDDGVRLWVNNQLIINNWTDHAPREDTGSIALVAGQKYAIKMEYYERGNGAVARLLWSGPGVSKQLIPQGRLYSTATPIHRPTITLSTLRDSINETGEPNVSAFSFRRIGPTDDRISLRYELSGTAKHYLDYLLPLPDHISAGSSGSNYMLQALDDGEHEGPETVTMRLLPSDDYIISGPDTVTVTINDDDPLPNPLPQISVTAATRPAVEGGSPAWGAFNFTRTGDISKRLAVEFTLDGTATHLTDYDIGNANLFHVTFEAGSATTGVAVHPKDDALVEGDETVTLSIVPRSSAFTIAGSGQATQTIVDNDVPPDAGDGVWVSELDWVSATSPFSGIKKDRATSGNPLRIGGTTYERGLGVHSPSSITYNLGGKYTRFTSYVGIDDAVGDGSRDGSAVFEVWVDGVLKKTSSRRTGADPAELLDVDVTGAQTLRLVTTTGGDNDYKDHADWADAKLYSGPAVSRPTVNVGLEQPTALEDGSRTGMFWISRDGADDTPLTVQYTISGTATAGTDYRALSGSATIPAGERGIIIRVEALEDDLLEGTETVVLTLSSSTAYNRGTSPSATVNILDNETAPVLPSVTLYAYDAAAAEVTAWGQFQVSRAGSTAEPLVVHYTIGGTATNGVDYEQLPGSVTIPANSHIAFFYVKPIDDLLYEGDETVTLTLSPSTAYTTGTPATATVTIADNEQPPVGGEPVYLSDLDWTSATSPFGGVRKDRTNSGGALRIGGVTYAKGLGVHSPSSITYNLDGQYTRFTAAVGIDDAVGNGSGDGSAVFEIWVDGVLKQSSTRRTGAMDAELLDVDITGAQTLRLVTTTGGDNDYKDHANWADAKLYRSAVEQRPTVTVEIDQFTAREDQTTDGLFWISRGTPGDEPLVVHYTVSGSATAGADYQALSGTATIPAGESGMSVRVNAIDDDLVEGTETVILTLAPADGYNVGPMPSATANIIDDDAEQSVQRGLTAEYFGNPDFTAPVTTRIDPVIAMGNQSAPWDLPMADRDSFSVRWSGFVDPPSTGTYQFKFNSNQGARVWVNGKLVIDGWEDAKAGDTSLVNYNGTVDLVAGQKAGILIEYYELIGDEHIFLSWVTPTGTSQTVPSERLSSSAAPAGTPLKIIALGDSITEGEKDHASYRFWLDRALASSGISHEMVGARSGVHNSWVGGDNVQPLYPWFDQDHQSRWGAHLDELRQQVGQWADQSPDLALIHIGHNDIRGGQSPHSLIDELGLFIDQLRAVNPDIKIAIALPVKNTSLGFVAEMDLYRALIPGLVASKTTAASPIIVVDQYTGFDPATMTYDNVHPNETGEKQIAERFYLAIIALLEANPA